ncbi:MAG: lactonase family protein [Terracidiphilus sp.]|nr:lactonase family protein [Terracidiphilus sp.]
MKEEVLRRGVSRRDFVKSAGAVALAHSSLGTSQEAVRRMAAKRTLAYVGTYTGAFGAGSNGEGIYRFEMDAATGELTRRKLVAKTPDPSWIAIHPSKKYLYAVNEVSDYGGNSGSVSAFAIDQASGDLTALNVVSSEGAGPCYLSIDALGKHAFVANYGGGSVAVLPILEGGLLGTATGVHRDSGRLGAAQATDAPAGSFAVSGHDAPHAHMIAPDPQGRFVLATDLGQDGIYVYRVDANTAAVSFGDEVLGAQLPSGDGPRHFAFHPNGRWFYSIQEEAATVVFFHYDASTGTLKAEQTVSALPAGFGGTSFASEILILPDGRFLYAAHRLHDTISAFSIGADGRLKWIGETSTMGDYPGQCRIAPGGDFLYACNRRSDSITCFRIHRESGLLQFTGQYTAVGSPASITFLS